MLCDAEALLEKGAVGIVFGFLHEDGTIDIDRCKEVLKIVGKKTSVFHRAFDVVPDWHAAMETRKYFSAALSIRRKIVIT